MAWRMKRKKIIAKTEMESNKINFQEMIRGILEMQM